MCWNFDEPYGASGEEVLLIAMDLDLEDGDKVLIYDGKNRALCQRLSIFRY